MTQGFAILLFGVLILGAYRARRARLIALSRSGIVPGTVTSVTRRHGPAFGEETSWNEVVVRYVDDNGVEQTLTQSAPGSGGWKPQVGTTVHMYRENVAPGLVTNALGRRGAKSEVIAECEAHADRIILWLACGVMAAGLVVMTIGLVT